MRPGSVALRDHRIRRWQSSVLGCRLILSERVEQALHRGGGDDAFGDHGVTLGRTEFGLQIGLPVDAFARNPGIEEIRPPIDIDGDVGNERDRGFEPALADKAPRTHHVGNDIDMKRRGALECNAHDGTFIDVRRA